jgi:superfamily II DNA or RNA helicase/HKD family nuclease
VTSPQWAEGLHESLLTDTLNARLREAGDLEVTTAKVDDADQPHVLARYLYEEAVRALGALGKPEQRVALANRISAELSEMREEIMVPPAQLRRIARRSGPGFTTYENTRPSTPLSDAALLTNSHGEPSLGTELKAEIDTSDEVDLLCAFVKWHGLRLLEQECRRLQRRGAPFRVITTTYMGATERAAIDRLVRDFGAHVKVQYDSQRTRLHAKAWLFRRRTEFDTAYVGSSNLSRAALLDGVEWNVRLSRVGTPTLLEKFAATFDTYWSDASFELYDPDRDGDKLDDALAEASGRSQHNRVTISLAGLEVRPYAYQQEILDAITAERLVHDHHRNLVVAATGTGKTVIAALDYRRLCEATGRSPSLLFVAHRKEILDQSLRTYREVLADASFGETYVSGSRPERGEHVFASVQSLTSYGVTNIPPSAYDVVVMDEFHHASAATYRAMLDHLQPNELLGLTATPERADGQDVRTYFNGRTAAELRLWDALGADLLCPFHYFAVADGTDLTQLRWVRGTYDEGELSNLYTGNRVRAEIILRELRDKVINPGAMRALGFCVDVAHAEYMTRVFNDAGIPARTVSGQTPQRERTDALRRLQSRELNVLFSAEVFNEGLDIPDVDTVLLLRPTQSATIFLQQLGRGLRRTPTKAVLTVLDFVGHQHEQFRWDRKLRALTGLTRRDLQRAVDRGFPFLPAGSQIIMDRQAQELVLDNLKGQIANSWRQIIAELRSYGDRDLPTFLDESGIELADILRRGDRSWTRLRREAGLSTPAGGRRENGLLKRVRALAHVDDALRASQYDRLLSDGAPDYSSLSPAERRLAAMLFFSLWPDGGGHASVADGIAALRAEQAVRSELASVIDLGFSSARHITVELGDGLSGLPLKIHARYQREEILAALGWASTSRKPSTFREGVLYSEELGVDAFLINLKKSDAEFSPSTMYRDYPISRTLFHWESQSRTTVASATGQRYLTGTSTVLLFVRAEKENEFGTSPYLFLGPATYVRHEGERPIAITWKLDVPMPTDFYHLATVAAQ